MVENLWLSGMLAKDKNSVVVIVTLELAANALPALSVLSKKTALKTPKTFLLCFLYDN